MVTGLSGMAAHAPQSQGSKGNANPSMHHPSQPPFAFHVFSLFQADVYVGHVPRSNLVSEEDKVAEVAFKTYVDANGTVAASDLVKVAYDLGCFGRVNQPYNPLAHFRPLAPPPRSHTFQRLSVAANLRKPHASKRSVSNASADEFAAQSCH
jgi:hypothetical protein